MQAGVRQLHLRLDPHRPHDPQIPTPTRPSTPAAPSSRSQHHPARPATGPRRGGCPRSIRRAAGTREPARASECAAPVPAETSAHQQEPILKDTARACATTAKAGRTLVFELLSQSPRTGTTAIVLTHVLTERPVRLSGATAPRRHRVRLEPGSDDHTTAVVGVTSTSAAAPPRTCTSSGAAPEFTPGSDEFRQ